MCLGIGWTAIRDESGEHAFCSEPVFPNLFGHTGGAIGATSILLIEPKNELIVSIIANSTAVAGITPMTYYIAQQFTQQNNWTQKLSKILAEPKDSDS